MCLSIEIYPISTIYTSWEIWKGKNRIVFENEIFLPDKLALTIVIAVKEIWMSKGDFSISSSITLWRSWALSGLLSEPHHSQWVRWDLPWFKINFDGSTQGHKVRVEFVIRNDINALVRAGSILIISVSVL